MKDGTHPTDTGCYPEQILPGVRRLTPGNGRLEGSKRPPARKLAGKER